MFIKFYLLIRKFLLQILSPPFCEYCRKFLDERTILCANCLQKIKSVAVHDLKVSVKYKIPVYAVGAYQEPLKSLVLAKMRSYRLVSIYLADLIYVRTPFRSLACDYLIPVPLHWSRTLSRGYNQSFVMATKLSQLRPELKVADILRRNRATKYQSGLSKFGRASNLQNAFDLKNIDQNLYRDKNLVLIDDVFTSGATLAAAVKTLLKLKPKSIAIVVACRAI